MQSSAAEKQTENTPIGGAGPNESTYKRAYNDRPYRGGEDGEQRPRGGRGNYRGNKPWDPSRGGRGAYRGNQDRNSNFRDMFRPQSTNQEDESSDAMYTQKPSGGRGGSSFRGDRGNYRGNSNFRGEFRGRGGSRPNPRWEEAKADTSGAAQNQEVIELELNDAQHDIYSRKLAYVRQNMRGLLDEDDVARICHQYNFDEKVIESKLNSYQTDSKYQGLEEFEWQTTQTRQEKEAAKRRKFEVQERKRLQKERQKELEEKRIAREKKQAEYAVVKAQRLAEKEERLQKKAEERAARDAARAAKQLEKEKNAAANMEEGDDQNEVEPQNAEDEIKATDAPEEETTVEPTAVEGAQSAPEVAEQEVSGNTEQKPAKSERKLKEKREKRPRNGRGKNASSQLVYRAKETSADQTQQDSADASQARDQEPEEQEEVSQAQAQADAIANQVLDTQESAKVDEAEEEDMAPTQQSADNVKQDQAADDKKSAPVDANQAIINYMGMMQGGQMPVMAAPQVPGQPSLSPEQQNLVNQQIMMWQQQQIQMLQQSLLQQQMMMQGGQLPTGAAGQPAMPFQMGFPMMPGMGQPPQGPTAGKK